MDPVAFWDLDNQAWPSLAAVLEKIKPRCGTVLDNVKFADFVENPVDYVESLYVYKPPNDDKFNKQLVNSLNYRFLEHRLSEPSEPMITSLNSKSLEKLRNEQIVSFRCMIQDVSGQGYCPDYVEIKDRQTGEIKKMHMLLRDLDDFSDMEELTDDVGYLGKDLFVGVAPFGERDWVSSYQASDTQSLSEDVKRMKLDADGQEAITLPKYEELLPTLFKNMGDAKAIGCRIKAVEGFLVEDLRPNDLVELTGLIYFDTRGYDSDSELELSPLMDVRQLPSLNIFSCIKLGDGHPELPIIEGKLFPMVNRATVHVSECVQILRDLLSYVFEGDRFAAAFVMVALVARVWKHESTSGSLGKFVMNVTGIPEGSPIVGLYQTVMNALMPRTAFLKITVEEMNSWKLTPVKKDGEFLEPGFLQLSKGTHLILDETFLKEGHLTDAGAKNGGVLRTLLGDQIVMYDYTYQFPAIPTHLPIVVMSRTKSIFPSDYSIRLKPDTKLTFEERKCRVDEMLRENGGQLRSYLSTAKSVDLLKYKSFGDTLIQTELQSFYELRNNGTATGFNSKMTPADFSAFITSCRYWSLLNGRTSSCHDDFLFWKDVERIRDSRNEPAA